MLHDRYTGLAEHFRNNFKDVPIIFENEAQPSTVPFVRMTILPIGNVRSEIGLNGSDLMNGFLVVDIFTKLGIGSGKSIEILESIMNIFASGTSITTDDDKTIRFNTPQPLPGRDDGHGFYQRTVQCPWYTFKL